MAPLPQLHRPPPELIDDAVAEILLRISPDEPAHLARAALVCKPWRRILSDRAFLRRYRAFHRVPPMLGVLQSINYSDGSNLQFVPTIADPPRLSFPTFLWSPLDCRHGRALLYRFMPLGLVVWDPISCSGEELESPADVLTSSLTATVLCAADGCDHLDCRSGPFRVVAIVTNESLDDIWASVYSSETGAWSVSGSLQFDLCIVFWSPGRQIGDALYFLLELEIGAEILKYDLTGGVLSVMKAPDCYAPQEGIVMTANDGGLGFAVVELTTLSLWSWNNAGPDDGTPGWVKERVVDLFTLLPSSLRFSLIGFSEGTDTIFVNTNAAGVFAVKLKSGQTMKVDVSGHHDLIVPYLSFYTPDILEARLPAS